MTLVPEPGSPRDAAFVTFLLKLLSAAGSTALAHDITAPAAAALGSAATQFVDRVARDWGTQGARNAERLATMAAEEAGLTVEALGERVAGSADARHIANKVLPAAVSARSEAQIRLLAKILANVSEHPERADEEALVANAVAPLEAIHFRMLATLTENPPASDEPTKPPTQRWSVSLLRIRLVWQMPVIVNVVLTLQSSGLIYLNSSRIDGGGAAWGDVARGATDLVDMVCRVTSFGELILDRARQAEVV